VPDSLDPTGVISVKGVHRLRRESGVTLLMVAVGMFALLSMAILALDVVNGYMASNQAQKTADAAALAGAQALASSGTTWNGVALSTVCNGSTGDADTRAQAVAAQNLIAGLPAQSVVTAYSSTLPGYNPQIQVTVTRTGIPTFLAGMFAVRTSSVSATALAEAYNPQTGYPPIAIHGVKPWAVYASTYTPGQHLPLTLSPCPPSAGQFCALDGPAPIACPSTNAVSCTQIASTVYHDNIACENGFNFTNGQLIGPGQVFQVYARPLGPIAAETTAGTECLIHASGSGPGQGQDSFVGTTITGGSNNPNPALQGVSNISRSDSVITVPVIGAGTPLPIIGFLQLGINYVDGLGNIDTVVLNRQLQAFQWIFYEQFILNGRAQNAGERIPHFDNCGIRHTLVGHA